MRRLVCQLTAGRLSISDAEPEDAVEVLSIYESVLEEGRFFITTPSEFRGTPDWQEKIIRQLNHQDNACFFVARLDRALVGVVFVRGGALLRMRHVGKLEIFVSAEGRGKGVGRVLMEAALTWAQEHPLIQKIGLSVFADNTRAVAMYRSLGFEEEGHRIGEYREADGTLRSDLLMSIRV